MDSLIFTLMKSSGGDPAMRQVVLDPGQVDELQACLAASIAERDAAKP